MKQYSIMLKPASSLCNLRCRYCFYCDVANLRDVASFGVMSEEVMRSILQNVARSVSAGDRVTFAFQGGEPTMAGLSFFRQFVQAADELLPGVRLDIGHTQFTPCLDELNRPGENVYALTPKRFASFYNTLFPYWLADYRAGHLSIAA